MRLRLTPVLARLRGDDTPTGLREQIERQRNLLVFIDEKIASHTENYSALGIKLERTDDEEREYCFYGDAKVICEEWKKTVSDQIEACLKEVRQIRKRRDDAWQRSKMEREYQAAFEAGPWC